MEHVYSSIDIGSDTIKLVVCELYKNHLNLLAATNTPAKGIKRGLIVDPKLAKEAIKNAFDEVEDMLGIRINKVIASVPNYFAEYTIINGQIEIADNIVTNKDIVEAYKEGIRKSIQPNMEFVNIVPIDFKLNGKTIMKDPKGFPGQTLEARAMMITTPKKNVYSVVSLLESMNIEVVDISTSAIGDLYSFKNKTIDSSVGAMVNIGAGTTCISIYNRGIPINTSVINVGGLDIDKDLAYAYKVSTPDAKKIKEKFALAYQKNADVHNVYEVTNFEKKKIKINQLEVSKIVNTSLNKILEKIKEEISDLTNNEVKYIIITGGISNLEEIEYLFHRTLGAKVNIGKIKLLGARNNKYSTAIGNIIYFIETLKLKGQEYTMISRDDMEVLSTPNKHLVSTSEDTMLGKVFGYFFGE